MTHSLEGHTVHRYDGELNNLHLRALEMGGLVLDQVRHALRALQDKDTGFANTVLEREHEVDNLELGIDDDVITMIAKRGPVARDLRVIMSISKTITDLERVGDEVKAGHGLGPASSIFKYYGTELNKRRNELNLSVFGEQGLGWSGDDYSGGALVRDLLRSKGNSIEGGTSEIQREIIGRLILR